jgi:LPS sulfotransferase NodH
MQSGEWHRGNDDEPRKQPDLGQYRFEAIRQLLLEADMRDAAIQEFLADAGIKPFTVVYEDFVADFETTVRSVLDFLEIPGCETVAIPRQHYVKIADDLSEAWAQRFRAELQAHWPNKGW